MRASTPSQKRTSFWPTILVVTSPVRKTTSRVISAPMPGIYMPNRCSGRIASGSNSSDWSMVRTIRDSTQAVIARGTQISSPVMKYRFNRRRSIAGTGTRSALAGGRVVALDRWLGSTLEVRGVPAAALELNTGGGQLLDKGFGLASRADGQRSVCQFLHDVLLETAATASVSVGGHGHLCEKGQIIA